MAAALPTKEANQFKLIVKAYETKQYKKGIKASDSILKKFPDHGETLAMKGLILNCMEKKTEAYELVRKGLKNDLKSHVCWHVYGLLYRSDRDYREAIKCYRNALRIDPLNQQILKDLSLLQVQMRDRAGFVESRRQLLTLKSNQRNNWIAFALAEHLNGDAETALRILAAYEGTLEEGYPPESEKFEHSEMLLYKVSLFEECGKFQEALDELDRSKSKIIDQLGWRERRASLLQKLQREQEAKEAFEELLRINPDNYRYFEGLQRSLGLQAEKEESGSALYSEETAQKLLPLYEELQKQFPKSAAAKRIPLDFLSGDSFSSALDAYVRRFLQKGIPSLFSDLEPLYQQAGKADIIEDVFTRLESSLRTTGSFPVVAGAEKAQDVDEAKKESPSSLLWLLFFLAQHHSKRGNQEAALAAIDEAILHTPTVMDLYLVKARILLQLGDAAAAAALADEARGMDLADRFLNSEAVRMLLEADEVLKAESTAALFTKDESQPESLIEMQCMWYELARGESFLRQRDYGRALKNFLHVNKHYNDMIEDQFDFHQYCLRKMTLTAYVDMLRFQDRLHSNDDFKKGAQGAIRTYLALYDQPSKSNAEDDDAANSSLSAADRRKARQKQRKAAKKAADEKAREQEAAAAAAAAAEAAAGKGEGGKSGAKKQAANKAADPDPDGTKLTEVEDKLAEASKHLSLLLEHAADDLQTHLAAFEVFQRKQRLLLCLRALKRMKRLSPTHPDVHRCTVRFFLDVARLPPPASPREEIVRKVIDAEREEFGSLNSVSDLEAFNAAFLESHKSSLPHRATAAEMVAFLNPSKKAEGVKILEDSKPEEDAAARHVWLRAGALAWSIEECIQVQKLLEGSLSDDSAAKKWRERCSALFPYSTFFEGNKSSRVVGIPTSKREDGEALQNGVSHIDESL